MQLSRALENKQNCLQQFTALKADLKKEMYVYIQLHFKLAFCVAHERQVLLIISVFSALLHLVVHKES